MVVGECLDYAIGLVARDGWLPGGARPWGEGAQGRGCEREASRVARSASQGRPGELSSGRRLAGLVAAVTRICLEESGLEAWQTVLPSGQRVAGSVELAGKGMACWRLAGLLS
ncbi:hypothetical protein CVM50_19925 [Pseudooceanicola marinus]|nr:hypothetical protein CVM50_19925 [Pseudooceanicola marinus]